MEEPKTFLKGVCTDLNPSSQSSLISVFVTKNLLEALLFFRHNRLVLFEILLSSALLLLSNLNNFI